MGQVSAERCRHSKLASSGPDAVPEDGAANGDNGAGEPGDAGSPAKAAGGKDELATVRGPD